MNAVKIIIIAHNNYNIVKVQINCLLRLSEVSYENIVIVDNYSDDGLRDWLMSQDDLEYIICDEKVENYADILNTVMQEFITEEDILLLQPEMILLPGTLKELQTVLCSDGGIGAVYPERLVCGESVQWDSVGKAINFAEQRKNNREYKIEMKLPPYGVIIRNKLLREIGEIDNTLFLPENHLMDLSFRGILSGYRYIKVVNAYLYQMAPCSCMYREIYAEDVDRKRIKEKWQMNYFGEIPNYDLLSCLQEEKDAAIKVLEVGCDCGANLLYVKNQYSNAELYGVEINPSSAKIAGHFAEVTIGNIEEQTLDYGDMQFDWIIFGDVLEHLRDPGGAISYCRKLLKPEGRILASIPNLMNYAVIYDLLNGNFSYSDTGLLDRTHIHFFTYNEIVKMFREEGYNIEKVDYVITGYYQEAEKAFVRKLLDISESAQEFMFAAFQFIVIATINRGC